jgi:hypothetical protein
MAFFAENYWVPRRMTHLELAKFTLATVRYRYVGINIYVPVARESVVMVSLPSPCKGRISLCYITVDSLSRWSWPNIVLTSCNGNGNGNGNIEPKPPSEVALEVITINISLIDSGGAYESSYLDSRGCPSFGDGANREMCRPQPPTPVQTDNSCAAGNCRQHHQTTSRSTLGTVPVGLSTCSVQRRPARRPIRCPNNNSCISRNFVYIYIYSQCRCYENTVLTANAILEFCSSE